MIEDTAPEPVQESASTPLPPSVRAKGRRPKRRRNGVMLAAVGLVLVVAAVSFAVWAVGGSNGTQSKYVTQQASKETLIVTVSASGNMVVDDQEPVTPEVSGTIKTLSVKLGQKVKAGDVLYTIYNRDLTQAVTKARASYRNAQQGVIRAQISLEQAQQNLDQDQGEKADQDQDDALADLEEAHGGEAELEGHGQFEACLVLGLRAHRRAGDHAPGSHRGRANLATRSRVERERAQRARFCRSRIRKAAPYWPFRRPPGTSRPRADLFAWPCVFGMRAGKLARREVILRRVVIA